jgi:hypothetical protein
MTIAEAKLQLWCAANGVSNPTATMDGPRIVEINGSAALAAAANAIPDAEAAAAVSAASQAAEAARKATPIVYDQPIETPLLALISDPAGKGVAVFALDDGTIETEIIHESPWPDKDALKAKLAAARAAAQTRRAQIKALKQTIQDLDPSAFPAGPERQTIRDLKAALQEVRRILAKE